MKRYALVIAISFVMVVALSLGNFSQPERIVTVPRIVIKEIEVIKEVGAVATQAELDRAFETIEYGRRVHQYFADHPEKQDKRTGGTARNLYWVDNYNLFGDLIRRAYLSK